MTWAASAVGVASIIGGSVMGSSAANKQKAGMREALEYQKQKDRETQARFQPYQEFGKDNINAFARWNDTATNPQSGYMDPGYEFRREQGLSGLYNNAASSGMLQSGDTLRAAQTYGQDMASQEYNNAFGRWLGEGRFRGDMAAMGQNAAAQEGALLNQGAANVGNIAANTDYGGSDRVWGDAIGGIGGIAGNAMAKYMRGRTPGSGTPGGSNIFGPPQGPAVQPRNLDGSMIG